VGDLSCITRECDPSYGLWCIAGKDNPDFAFKKRKKLDQLKSSHQSSLKGNANFPGLSGLLWWLILTDLFKKQFRSRLSLMLKALMKRLESLWALSIAKSGIKGADEGRITVCEQS
jgi:hypothetical protein